MPKSIQIGIPGGDGTAAHHNAGIFLAIGGLVTNWANNESVFIAMLQALFKGDKHVALIVWFSHPNTRARLELLERMARQLVKDAILLTDIEKAAEHFRGFTRARNFFCHATYQYDGSGRIAAAHSVEFNAKGEPLRAEAQLMDNSGLNRIADTHRRLMDFNGHLWALVERVEVALGAPPSKPQ